MGDYLFSYIGIRSWKKVGVQQGAEITPPIKMKIKKDQYKETLFDGEKLLRRK